MTRFTWPLAAVALAAVSGCAAADVNFDCVGEAPMCEILDVVGEQRGLAGGISVTKVEFFQAVQVDLMVDGAANADHPPIVAGREALVRIHVSPNDDWQVRDVAARFYIRDAAGDVVAAGEGVGRPTTASVEGDLGSTINIELPGNMVPAGELNWSVELVEGNAETRSTGRVDGAEFPEGDETAPFVSADTGESIRIYLVPIEDSSGEVPDANEILVNQIRDAVYDIYPVPYVEIEVGEPWVYSGNVAASGLPPLLDAMTEAIREEAGRDIDDDQFVFGLTEATGGGLSWLGGFASDVRTRHSVGSAWTIPHEIGHAIGRPHTPGCGAAGPDENYPHADSAIGVWGWSTQYGDLKDPTATKDFMSYCNPTFISDYVWSDMYESKLAIDQHYYGDVGGTARRVESPWRELWFHTTGDVALGSVNLRPATPAGDPVQVELLAEGGAVLARVDGIWMPFVDLDDEGAGVLLLPENEPRTWDSVRIVHAHDHGTSVPVGTTVVPEPLGDIMDRRGWR